MQTRRMQPRGLRVRLFPANLSTTMRCDALHRLRLDAAAAYPQSLSRLGLGGQIGLNLSVNELKLSRIVQGLGPKQPESYNED